MNISEVRIKLIGQRTDRLKAFATITFDGDFVVRDIKVIEGTDGYFVAMPSRKLTDRCPSCGCKNTLRSRFCNDCGVSLSGNRIHRDSTGRTKIHADIAHPVNSKCRSYIQREIVDAFNKEVELSKQPGYSPTELGDDYEDDVKYRRPEPAHLAEPPTPAAEPPAPDSGSSSAPTEPAAEPGDVPESDSSQDEPPSFGEGIV